MKKPMKYQLLKLYDEKPGIKNKDNSEGNGASYFLVENRLNMRVASTHCTI